MVMPETRTDCVEATKRFGVLLGALLDAGDTVGLIGDLGAGKTHFVQGIAQGLGVDPERINSPTYTLIAEHQGRVPLYHMDAYRLADASDLQAIGFDEYIDGRDGVLIIEWADRILDALPEDLLIVRLAAHGPRPDDRSMTFEPHGARAKSIVARMFQGTSV
jgi:tRNA threonylcarbamoyladenosine biosynthesis protein TsaE